MSDWNKFFIANTSKINRKENTKYTILIKTDTYGIYINNLDIKVVIQQNLPTSFNIIIQRMD